MLINFNLSALLNRIEECKKQKKANLIIGDIFLEFVRSFQIAKKINKQTFLSFKLPKMKPYSKFVTAQRNSEQLILEKARTSPDFNEILNVKVTFFQFQVIPN